LNQEQENGSYDNNYSNENQRHACQIEDSCVSQFASLSPVRPNLTVNAGFNKHDRI
jgi:hypothetical protein